MYLMYCVTVSTLFQSTLPVRGATICLRLKRQRRWRFQSTLPVRGATACSPAVLRHCKYFNPRSPCGERLDNVHSRCHAFTISIHAPRAGSDVVIILNTPE